MARILTPEQFRECPRGTLFCFGSSDLDMRRELLILDNVIPMRDDGIYGGPPYWGFWAIDPLQALLTCAEGTAEKIKAALEGGTDEPLAFEPDRYWSYEDAMDVFLVYASSDVVGLHRLLRGDDWQSFLGTGSAA